MTTISYLDRSDLEAAINPYASPADIEPVVERGPPENPYGFVMRSGIYLLTGVALLIAFCSPLDIVFGEGFRRSLSSGQWGEALSVLASSLIAGWIFDPLVRMKTPTAIVGLAYMLLNSMLFVFFSMLFSAAGRGHAWPDLGAAALFSTVFGPIGCLLCVHLVTPICFGGIYWAGRTVDLDETPARFEPQRLPWLEVDSPPSGA